MHGPCLQMIFKIKGHTKFAKVKIAYCAKKAIDATATRLSFDSNRIYDTDSLGIEDGDGEGFSCR